MNAEFLSRTIVLLLLGYKENRPFRALDLHYSLSDKVLFLFPFLRQGLKPRTFGEVIRMLMGAETRLRRYVKWLFKIFEINEK
jgi:hypothetical protein